MSYNSLFGNPTHPRTNIHNDPVKANLGTKLNGLRDRRHTQKEIPIFDVANSVIYQPVSTYGASLLDTTSLADLRAQILENSNEEAIRLLADSNNEINFYTGGTGASNLKLQILDSSIDVKNSATLNTANIVLGPNNHLKQTINDNGNRVLFESATGNNQYCLYSYEAGTNSGLLIQANNDVMEINNYKNSNNSYQPISINRSAGGYLVVGDGVNNSGITANFIANGTSVFTSGGSPQLHISATNIQPYKNIIPSGSLDIGATASRFNNIYNNISTITSEIRLNTFAPTGTDYTKKGIFFRESFNSIANGDNMCIRSVARPDVTSPSGYSGDRLMVSSYGGVSINYNTNNALNEGTDNRIALFHDQITIHKDMVGNQDGQISLGTSGLKYNEVYSNNIRAHTSLYTDQIRSYTNGASNPIHFHTSSATFDANQSISVDNLFSSSPNRDLYIGNSASDIKMRFINGTGGEIQPYSSIVPPNSDGLIDLGSSSKSFGYLYATSVETSTVTSNDLEANVSIIARGNNAYISAEDDTSTNGKVQLVSENSSTYTGYVSFLKNDTRELFIGYDNALQFENGSNFTIRSNAQTYMSFIHDATAANRKININVDLIPSSNAYDLGNFTNKFVQIHGITINASSQVSTDLISPYAGGSSTSVKINGDLLPENAIGGSGTRNLGNATHLWKQLFASTNVIDTSDRNTKKDIKTIDDALPLVRKLKPVSYIRKAGKRRHTGFISQDILEISPWKDQWAAYCDMGDLKGLRYSEFISVNTKAIQELDHKVSRLASGISTETKLDLSVHTPNEEIIERIEALENKKPLETVVEEYDDSELKEEMKQLKIEIIDLKIENKKQEDCISQLIADNMNLTEKLNMLMERFDKFVEDKPNVKLQVVEEEPLLSENGLDHMEQIEERLHNVEQKVTKLSNKQTKLVTAINKLKK